jgi:hypothetical protein
LAKKPRASLTTIGVFLERPHVIERYRQRGVAGCLSHDDLDQHHLLDRREEVDANELVGALAAACESADRGVRKTNVLFPQRAWYC